MILFAVSLVVWGLLFGITFLCCVTSRGKFLTTGPVQDFSTQVWLRVGDLSKHRWLSVLLIVGLPLVFRLAALPILDQPYGRSHDEYSYILAGQTFALGRLTNPTPPLWKFFETEHVLMVPTYMSKYPPTQGLFIAIGVLLGDPWIGVLISYLLMYAAIYWAALAFLPGRFAIFAGLIPLIHPGVSSYWCNSFFGGAATAIGGALVSGALGRLRTNIRATTLAILVFGLVILANTRPFEGAVFSGTACLVVLLQRRRARKPIVSEVVRKSPLPISLGMFLLGLMLYYNFRLTGNPFMMPYVLWQKQYSPVPLNFFSKMTPFPHYNCPILETNYTVVDVAIYQDALNFNGFWYAMINNRFAGTENFFIGVTLPPLAIAAIFLAWKDKRMAPLWIGTICMSLAICTTAVGFLRHYPAPATAAYAILMVQGYRHLRQVKWKSLPLGLAFSRVVLVCCLLGTICGFFSFPGIDKQMKFEQAEFPRREIMHKLEAIPGKHLIVVHYAKGHDPRREYVVNEPDVGKARIIWAREFDDAENQKLLDLFKDRTVWLFDPDHMGADQKVQPKLYTWEESRHAELSKEVDDSSWNHPPVY